MYKRQGWIRLGIVISILFLASFHVVLYRQYKDAASSIASSALDKSVPDEWRVVEVESRLFSCSAGYGCTIKTVPYLIATLSPLFVIWGLIPAIFATCYWIRAGFRGKS